MCFSKYGKDFSEKFFTNGHLLEQFAECPYLGPNICNSGSFKAAEKTLTAKALIFHCIYCSYTWHV